LDEMDDAKKLTLMDFVRDTGGELGEPGSSSYRRFGKLVEGEKTRPMTALEAVSVGRTVVLLGDPGSGKSTFINRLCLAFARGIWTGLDNFPKPDRLRLPVLLILRDFANWISRENVTEGDAALLREYLVHDLERRNLGFAVNLVEGALERETGAMVFLDGLDEVPPEQRKIVLAAVRAFVDRYDSARLLLTCRVVTYERPEWQLPAQFRSHRLAPFDRAKIDQFVTVWYEEIGRRTNDASDRYQQLAAALKEALRRSDLVELASNPLLLTVMSLVHTQDKVLPDHRVVLYERAVEILLWRWESQKHGNEPARLQQLLQAAGRNSSDLRKVLREQAFKAHQQAMGSKDSITGIDAASLENALARLHSQKRLDWAEQVVDLMRQRTGLLVEREPGVFAFPHRTFQEYLAATQVALPSHYAEQVRKLVAQGDYWREVILLSVGYWVHVLEMLDMPRLVVRDLCPDEEPTGDAGWRRVRLAAEALLEIGVHRLTDMDDPDEEIGLGERLKRSVLRLLTALVEGGHLPAAERVHVGEVLGKLGDPRFDPGRFYLPCRFRGKPEERLGFVKIPAGQFFMGEEGDHPGPLTMPYDYWIARYPVTVAQFGAFVDDGGYRDTRWWGTDVSAPVLTDAAREWLDLRKPCPRYWESQRLHPNRPVMGVCWFEAMAYCAWLDAKLRGEFPAGYRVMLPTEVEWEMAAQDVKVYPLSNIGNLEDDQNRVKYGSEIAELSPVGTYPAGATQSGLMDMAGGVWEWTSGKADYLSGGDFGCVVQGRSWHLVEKDKSSALHIDDYYGDSTVFCGFRVVVSLAFDS